MRMTKGLFRRDAFRQCRATICIRRLARVYHTQFSCDFSRFVPNEFVFSDGAATLCNYCIQGVPVSCLPSEEEDCSVAAVTMSDLWTRDRMFT